jgi:hypothetical protein
MKTKILILILILASLLLASCAKSSDSGATAVVEKYLNALVSKNDVDLATLSCADWEAQALTQLDSFAAVTARLDGVSCSVSGKDGDTTLVTCQGKIISTYDNEDTTLDLSRFTYLVVQQGSDWLVCGQK